MFRAIMFWYYERKLKRWYDKAIDLAIKVDDCWFAVPREDKKMFQYMDYRDYAWQQVEHYYLKIEPYTREVA